MGYLKIINYAILQCQFYNLNVKSVHEDQINIMTTTICGVKSHILINKIKNIRLDITTIKL